MNFFFPMNMPFRHIADDPWISAVPLTKQRVERKRTA
jgi:hypothetical protein